MKSSVLVYARSLAEAFDPSSGRGRLATKQAETPVLPWHSPIRPYAETPVLVYCRAPGRQEAGLRKFGSTIRALRACWLFCN
jgi:hypothetical protein